MIVRHISLSKQIFDLSRIFHIIFGFIILPNYFSHLLDMFLLQRFIFRRLNGLKQRLKHIIVLFKHLKHFIRLKFSHQNPQFLIESIQVLLYFFKVQQRNHLLPILIDKLRPFTLFIIEILNILEIIFVIINFLELGYFISQLLLIFSQLVLLAYNHS